ncbi:hypothetical protein C8R44DRAFT_731104 [Mycena epipterygia]|nr:hypothetical protein C8R44DRAFT_731104 [Mycena epipterygia]
MITLAMGDEMDELVVPAARLGLRGVEGEVYRRQLVFGVRRRTPFIARLWTGARGRSGEHGEGEDKQGGARHNHGSSGRATATRAAHGARGCGCVDGARRGGMVWGWTIVVPRWARRLLAAGGASARMRAGTPTTSAAAADPSWEEGRSWGGMDGGERVDGDVLVGRI